MHEGRSDRLGNHGFRGWPPATSKTVTSRTQSLMHEVNIGVIVVLSCCARPLTLPGQVRRLPIT